MAINQPGDVTVIAPVSVPNDAAPATRAASVLGGYVAVVDNTERDAIPVSSRKQGMLVRTNAGVYYVLGAGLTNSDWILATFGSQDIAPVAAASTGNLVLSGNQTIDGVVNPPTVVAWQQTLSTENGIYDTGAGAWVRRADQDASADFRPGTLFVVAGGTANAGKLATYVGALNPTLGVTALPYSLSFPAPTPVTDDGKLAVASSGSLAYALLADANVLGPIGGSKIAPQFGAQAVTVTGAGYIGIGTAPIATTGDVRVKQGFSIKGRTAANNNDFGILDWGVTTADYVTLGSLTSALQIAGASPISLVIGGSVAANLGASNFTFGAGFNRFTFSAPFTINIVTASTPGPVVGAAGLVQAQDLTGTGAADGGAMTVRAGNSTNGTGGAIVLKPGSGGTAGGAGTLQRGSGTACFTWNDTGIALYNAAPVAQPARVGQLTDGTTGTPSNTIPDAGAVYVQATINNIHASLLAKINALELIIHNLGASA